MDRLLTAVERERLRELIDCARRAAINWQAVMRCLGCGVEQLDSSTGEPRYVAGCPTCSDRRCKHRARARSSVQGCDTQATRNEESDRSRV